jgi:hypothetical protein
MTDTYEARGPHLPDVLTRQSPWVYLFVGAALVHAVLGAWELSGRGLAVDVDAILQIRYRIDDALVALLGAALFIRHPDARRTRPVLAIGLGLLMLGTLLRVAQGPVEGLLSGLAPTDDALLIPTPASFGLHVLNSLVAIAGIAYVAAGLRASREQPDRSGERMALVWLATTGIVSVLLPYVVVGFDRALTQSDVIVVGINLAIPVLSALAWAYLMATTLGGWRNRELPRPAWALTFVGGLLLLAIQVVNSLLITVANTSESPEPGQLLGLFTLMGAASTTVWALVLAAFALGLPARPERDESRRSMTATDA